MKYTLCMAALLGWSTLTAQNTSGITGKRDDSYSNKAALETVQKDFPKARLAVSKHGHRIKKSINLPYCVSPDRTLSYDLYQPRKDPNGVTLIFIHGGGWRSGNKLQHKELGIEMASRGYTVLLPEYRLSTEALYPAAVADIKTLIARVKKEMPAQKLAVAGFSAGGQMAAFIAATPEISFAKNALCPVYEPLNVDAAIDIDGILAYLHPESGEGDDSRGISAATYYFGYSKTENPDLWISAGALAHVSSSTPPFLFINSREERMHAGREDFIGKLNASGIYSEVHTFSEAPHSFPQMNLWFLPTIDLMDAFLTQTLLKR